MVVSLAVLYNVIFVLGRAVFWELNNSVPALWWTLDYLCDIIYILDTAIHAHEGESLLYFQSKYIFHFYWNKLSVPLVLKILFLPDWPYNSIKAIARSRG